MPDPRSYKGFIESLYGLPVYTSKWMPDTMIVMGNRSGKTQAQQGWEYAQKVYDEAKLMADRPYGKLTGSELSRILADQLQSGGPINPKPTAAFPVGPIETTAFSGTQNVETTFRVGADGRPEAVTRLVDKPSKGAARNGGESELAWLKRRVDEICWRPT